MVATEEGERKLDGQLVLVAVGRKPNLEELGLEAVGVKAGKDGIVVNERMQTEVPGIYAAGDAIGGTLLAHVASEEGVVAAENALGKNSTMDYSIIPRCIYTTPEVASVGMTEKEAREHGYEVRIGKFPFAANGRAVLMRQRGGFVKIVADSKSAEILGIHIIGPHATELISEAALAMKMEGTPQELSAPLHPHPTLSEAIMEAALDVDGIAFHIPPRRSR